MNKNKLSTVYVTRREATEGLIAVSDLRLVTDDPETVEALDSLRAKLADVILETSSSDL